MAKVYKISDIPTFRIGEMYRVISDCWLWPKDNRKPVTLPQDTLIYIVSKNIPDKVEMTRHRAPFIIGEWEYGVLIGEQLYYTYKLPESLEQITV